MGCLRFSKKVTSTARLDGKTAIVTGCNTGIGKVTVKDLYKRGCRVIMACRDVVKAEEAAKDIRLEGESFPEVGEIVVMRQDLSSFASIRQCAEELLRTETNINLVINNAGVMVCPKGLTEDGFETQFAVNHLGHFLFTLLLMPRIIRSAPARIVNLSSSAHLPGSINFEDINSEKSYSEGLAYAQSKLANILFTKELAKRLHEHGHDNVKVYAVHPGAVDTELQRHVDTTYGCGLGWMYRNVFGAFVKSPEQGARTSIYCAVDEEAGKETGQYYADCTNTTPSAKARNPDLATRLWEESVKWVKLEDFNPFLEERPHVSAHQPILVSSKNGW